MRIIVTESYQETCKVTANIIVKLVNDIPDAKLGLATGETAEGVYSYLVEAYECDLVDFSRVSTINLDEYVGMCAQNPLSYRNYMDRLLFDKVNIKKENTYVPSGTNNVEEEIKIFNKKLYSEKPLDFQLLGVGVNGHIGFNEPGDYLHAGVHVENLAEDTIASNARFFKSIEDVPRRSITMGIGDILKASKIVLLATGSNKVYAIQSIIMDDVITTQVPATFLKLHRDVTVIIDKALAKEVGYI